MTIISSSLVGPIGPSGPSGVSFASADDTTSLLTQINSLSGITLGDMYVDTFSSSDGIDSSSILFHNKLGSCIEVPRTSTTKTFSFDFLSPLGWTWRNLQGPIVQWIKDATSAGHFEGETKQITGSASDKGSGKVGFICNSHGYSSGSQIEIRNSINYSGTHTVDASTSPNEIVVIAAYLGETFSSSVVVNQRIRLGSGGDNTAIEEGLLVNFGDSTSIIQNISGTGSENQSVTLSSDHITSVVLSISGIALSSGTLTTPSYVSNYVRSFTPIIYTVGPSARSWAELVYDPVGKQAFLFGGNDSSGALNDLWKYNVTTNEWTLMNPSGTPPSARSRFSMVLDSTNRTLLVFGGLSSDETTNLNDLYKYDITSNTWSQPGVTGGPPAIRREHAASYDSYNKWLLIFGGYNVASGSLGDSWKCDLTTSPNYTWTQLGTTAVRRGCAGSYDPRTKLSFQSCGSTTSIGSSDANEIYAYYYNLNAWLTAVTTLGPRGGRVYHTMNLSPFDRSLIIYGGDDNVGGFLQVIEYNIDQAIITDYAEYLNGYRQGHMAAFDLDNHRLLVFGGDTPTTPNLATPTMLEYRMKNIVHPKALYVAYSTDANHLVSKSAGDFYSVTTSQSTLDIPLYYAVSFDNRLTWKVFTSARAWRDIVRYSSNWQYKDGADAWQNSSDLTSALESAFSVSANQWSSLVSNDPEFSTYVTDKIPTMTTNTTPSPYVASESSYYSASYQAYKAMNHDGNSSYWSSANGAVTNQYVQIDMGSGNAFYPMKWRWMNTNNTYQPKRFKLQASNDGSNWTDIDSMYANVDCPLVGNGTWAPYVSLPITTAYRYYRMYILSGYSATYIYVSEIEIIDYNVTSSFGSILVPGPMSPATTEWKYSGGFNPGTSTTFDVAVGMAGSYVGVPYLNKFTVNYATAASNMTYISKSWEASQINPTSAFCLLDIETTESLVLDTDLKAWVSMDDGANYEQITGLIVLLASGNRQVLTGNKTGLTARSDQTMRIKVTTANSKEVRLHGVALGVRY